MEPELELVVVAWDNYKKHLPHDELTKTERNVDEAIINLLVEKDREENKEFELAEARFDSEMEADFDRF